MNNVCSHSEYYRQFVTQRVKNILLQSIEKNTIVKSNDPYFNDIPLGKWDRISEGNKTLFAIDGSYSLSNGVCILKEAARQIKVGA